MKKAYDKCKKLIEKEGHFKTYIRAMAELEIFINEVRHLKLHNNKFQKIKNKYFLL